mmetsp:Transcript_29842/g.92266  ORF Transcript_29842/g.92266 Transcript_29842/m.92266 type:complete len:459 (-) Transcript_29842:169-1545(-)
MYDVRRLKSARTKLAQHLLHDLRNDRWISVLLLSSSGDWVNVYKGPAKQLDLTWFASLSPAQLCCQVYRVEYGAVHIEPREVTWLSDLDAPFVLGASTREVVLGWPNIEGCRKKIYSSASFQVEVKEGCAWRSSQVPPQRQRPVSAVHDSEFVPLEPVLAIDGVHIIDLRPATWYRMRLRISCAGKLAAASASVSVSTKCGRPNIPTSQLSVAEQDSGSFEQDQDGSFESSTSMSLSHFMNKMPPPQCDRRLRLSWAEPLSNGYPIQQYILQQRDLVLSPFEVVARGKARMPQHDPNATWTPWRVVYAHLLPECLIRAPAQCPASVISARHTLGLPTTRPSTLSDTAEHSKCMETPPRFVAVEFRVAAANALGMSMFSKATRITRDERPHIFAPAIQRPNFSRIRLKYRCLPRSSCTSATASLEAELVKVVSALEFPISRDALQLACASCSEVHGQIR